MKHGAQAHDNEECSTLSHQTHRPVVRLLNELWNLVRPNSRIKFHFADQFYPVHDWFADDTMTFGETDDMPDVYLYREMEFRFRLLGLTVLLVICDDPNLQGQEVRLMAPPEQPFRREDITALKLHFSRPFQNMDGVPWMSLPVEEVAIVVNSLMVNASGCHGFLDIPE